MRIAIPQNMYTTRDHLKRAGWEPVFDYGESESADDIPSRKKELNRGIIEPTGDIIIQTRSRDIPRLVAWKHCDVALVGSDCAEGRFQKNTEVLSRFPYGREMHAPQPRVEIVVSGESSIHSIRDIARHYFLSGNSAFIHR